MSQYWQRYNSTSFLTPPRSSGTSITVKWEVLGWPTDRETSKEVLKKYDPGEHLNFPETEWKDTTDSQEGLTYGLMCELEEALIEGEKDLDGKRYELRHKDVSGKTGIHWECGHEPDASTGATKHSVRLRLPMDKRVLKRYDPPLFDHADVLHVQPKQRSAVFAYVVDSQLSPNGDRWTVKAHVRECCCPKDGVGFYLEVQRRTK